MRPTSRWRSFIAGAAAGVPYQPRFASGRRGVQGTGPGERDHRQAAVSLVLGCNSRQCCMHCGALRGALGVVRSPRQQRASATCGACARSRLLVLQLARPLVAAGMAGPKDPHPHHRTVCLHIQNSHASLPYLSHTYRIESRANSPLSTAHVTTILAHIRQFAVFVESPASTSKTLDVSALAGTLVWDSRVASCQDPNPLCPPHVHGFKRLYSARIFACTAPCCQPWPKAPASCLFRCLMSSQHAACPTPG
jgi:hypothetical protein